MSSWLIWLVAIVSIATCLFLWFRDVLRIMKERRSMVESAAGQLSSFRKKVAGARYDPELAEVLVRCENIYRQAVQLYHQTLRKPWIWLPAILMGFRPIWQEEYEQLPPEEDHTKKEPER